MSQLRKALLIILFVTCLVIGGILTYSRAIKKQPTYATTEAFITLKFETCNKAEYRSICLKQAAQEIVKHFSIKTVGSVLKTNEKTPLYFDRCHELAHYLGQYEYKKMKSIPKVYSEGSDACLGGIYHGAIEGYFIEKNISIESADAETQIGKIVSTICGKQEDYTSSPQEFTECNHGLGHAMMYVAENDVIRALRLCDYVPTTQQRQICYTGAFMQNNDGIGDVDHPSTYAKKDDPLYPCYILEKKYQSICYTYGALTLYQSEPLKAIQICSSIPEEFRLGCYETYGRDRTMMTSDPEEIARQCNLIQNKTFLSPCLYSAAYNLVIRFGPESPLPSQVCMLANEESRDDCYSMVITAIKNKTKDEGTLLNICNGIPEQYRPTSCNI